MTMMMMASTSSSRVMPMTTRRSTLTLAGGPRHGGGVSVSAVQRAVVVGPSSMTCSPDRRAAKVGSGSSVQNRATTRTRSSSTTALAALPSSDPVDNALAYGATSYVPSPMDYSALQSQLIVLGVVGVMTAYWWYVLVPGARVNLAVNKKSGKLRDYLEELKGDDDRKLERFFYQKWLAKVRAPAATHTRAHTHTHP